MDVQQSFCHHVKLVLVPRRGGDQSGLLHRRELKRSLSRVGDTSENSWKRNCPPESSDSTNEDSRALGVDQNECHLVSLHALFPRLENSSGESLTVLTCHPCEKSRTKTAISTHPSGRIVVSTRRGGAGPVMISPFRRRTLCTSGIAPAKRGNTAHH